MHRAEPRGCLRPAPGRPPGLAQRWLGALHAAGPGAAEPAGWLLRWRQKRRRRREVRLRARGSGCGSGARACLDRAAGARGQVGSLCLGLSSDLASLRRAWGPRSSLAAQVLLGAQSILARSGRWGLTPAIAAGFRTARSPISGPRVGRFSEDELARDRPPSDLAGRPLLSRQGLLRRLLRFRFSPS